MEILILSTVILSAIVAMFPAIGCLLYKKTIEESFDEFIYSFLGGLLGGFIGILIGVITGYFSYLIVPPQSDFGFPDLRHVLFWFIGLFVGVLIGGIITIKPIIKFFSDN